jgi:hypothetical protein
VREQVAHSDRPLRRAQDRLTRSVEAFEHFRRSELKEHEQEDRQAIAHALKLRWMDNQGRSLATAAWSLAR